MPNRDDAKDTDKIFHLPYATYINVVLKTWAQNSGITKTITFHIVPYMKTVCESYASADLVRQLPVLLGGMAVYALEVWLAYRKSAARFEKVDL